MADSKSWKARYAWNQSIGGPGLEVRLFRRTVEIANPPQTVMVRVSAESRYVFSVNGARVGRGPLKGTIREHHYEEYDIAPYLTSGTNVLAAEVRWFGIDRPESEVHSERAGFLLEGPEDLEISTPAGWRVCTDTSVTADRTSWFSNSNAFLTHMERIDAGEALDGWNFPDFDDSKWEEATDAGSAWMPDLHGVYRSPVLVPRQIDQLTETPSELQVAKTSGGSAGSPVWSLAPGEAGEVVLSAGALTTGYPRLRFRGGAGRTVQVIYAEAALFPADDQTDKKPDPASADGSASGKPEAGGESPEVTIPAPDGPWKKGIRDDIESGQVAGYRDTIILDGGEYEFEPFLWRTFWFLGVRVSAGDSALELIDADYLYTTYPADRVTTFTCDRPEYAEIDGMAWRTLRLCSHETFEDCPYYEQLHYLGDARLEALTHMYLTGDTAYVKRSIEVYRNSARWNGLVESRPPSADPQFIPYFALLWVLMLEDFWDYAGPAEAPFLQSCLHAMDGTLVYFRDRLAENGFVGKVEPWNMVDRTPGWDRGEPPALVAGESTYLTALFVLASRTAARLHREIGHPDDAYRWERVADASASAVCLGAWSKKEGLFLEGPGREDDPVSQHCQVLPILAGIATEEQVAAIRRRLVADDSLISMKLMQSFYLARALEQIGEYEAFHTHVLRPWRKMQELNLSTCAEYLPGRSDCHAWSSWPALDFVRTVLGVRPTKPGFRGVTIAPQTAGLAHASGRVETPAGAVDVSWRHHGSKLHLEATAPKGTPVEAKLGSLVRRFPNGGALELTL